MTDHACPTGLHKSPSRRCYWAHRCRCERCRTDHAEYEASRRPTQVQQFRRERAGTTRVDVPTEPWNTICRVLAARGVTVEQWLERAAAHAAADHQPDNNDPVDNQPAGETVWIDSGPLVDALEARARARGVGMKPLLGPSDYRAWLRARADGRVTEATADRLSVCHLGVPLMLVYGQEVA